MTLSVVSTLNHIFKFCYIVAEKQALLIFIYNYIVIIIILKQYSYN